MSTEEIGRKIKEKKPISIPELFSEMKTLNEDQDLLPIQSRTLQYLKKFSKIEREKAAKIKEKLLKIEEIDEEKAVQIINIIPRTPEEIKEIFHEKVIIGELAEKILSILREEGVI